MHRHGRRRKPERVTPLSKALTTRRHVVVNVVVNVNVNLNVVVDVDVDVVVCER